MDPPSQVPETATSSGMVRLHAARRVRAALLKLRTLSSRQRVVTISASLWTRVFDHVAHSGTLRE